MNELHGPHCALFGVLVEQPNEQSIDSGRHPALAIAIDKVALLLSRGRAALVRLIGATAPRVSLREADVDYDISTTTSSCN